MPIPTGERPFDQLAADLVADQCAANPLLGTTLGLTEYDDLLPDLSVDGIARRERTEDAWAQRLRDLPDGELTPDERIDRDLALMSLRGRELMRHWADWRRSPDHYAGTALSSVFLLLTHRVRSGTQLATAVAARLRATPALLDQGVANLDPALAHPALLRRSLGQIAAGASYARSVADEFDDPADAELVRDAGEVAATAYLAFGEHVTALVDQATGDWAIGEERYSALLTEAEGLGYGARELRAKGQAAFEELAADMTARAQELRGTDDYIAVVKSFNEDHPATPEAMLALYREATDAARAFCVEHDLVTMPEGERCEVAPSAPFSRAMLAVAHYFAPPPFAPPRAGSHVAGVGYFFVPYPPDGATPEQITARLATNNEHGAWSIAVHEAYPGHHWHLARLSWNASLGRARPLRFVLGSAYFVEGWGLYTEDLLRERGFFRTLEQELAQRDFRLFRAARIIVDTSLHLGEMTIEEATEFMATRTSLSRETAAAEVLRYCAWPTQASSYLTGALEIARMRQRWEAEERGTLKEFHDQAGGSGRLPIGLVERTLFA